MRRYHSRLLLLHRRLARDPVLAEDLCQDTLVRAWDRLGSFRGEGSFAAWLSRLAVNEFRQHHRRVRRRPETALDAVPEPAHEPCFATPDLERLLGAVDRDEQIVLILCYAHGLTIEEIAVSLDRPAGSVKSQLHRAKEKIRRRFGITS